MHYVDTQCTVAGRRSKRKEFYMLNFFSCFAIKCEFYVTLTQTKQCI